VGHAAIVDADSGVVLLSQFPEPHGTHGRNVKLDYMETLEKRAGILIAYSKCMCPMKSFLIKL